MGIGGIALRIINLDNSWISFKPRPPYTRRKYARYALNRRLRGLHSRPGQFGGRKTLMLLKKPMNS
jgi:hypothetical protein